MTGHDDEPPLPPLTVGLALDMVAFILFAAAAVMVLANIHTLLEGLLR